MDFPVNVFTAVVFARLVSGMAHQWATLTVVLMAASARRARDVDVKAALLYNFARFAAWPALSSDAPHRHLRRR